MDLIEIRKLYDRQMREDPHVSTDCEVERLEFVTRVTGKTPGAEFGNILFSRVTKDNASEEIRRQSEHYSRLGWCLIQNRPLPASFPSVDR